MHEPDADEAERRDALASLKGNGFVAGRVIREMFNAWNADDAGKGLYFASPDATRYTQSGARGHLDQVPARSNRVCFPLNVDDVHWALLVYDRSKESPSFHLYDSFGENERNLAVAQKLAKNVLKEVPHGSGGFDFVRHAMPLQKGNDCAISLLGLCKMFQEQARAQGKPLLSDIGQDAFQPYLDHMSREKLSSYLSGGKRSPNPALQRVFRREAGTQGNGREEQIRSDAEIAYALHKQLNGNMKPEDVEAKVKAENTPLRALPTESREIHVWGEQSKRWEPMLLPDYKAIGRIHLCNEGRDGAVQVLHNGPRLSSLMYYPPHFTNQMPEQELRRLDGMEVAIAHDGQGGIRTMPEPTKHQLSLMHGAHEQSLLPLPKSIMAH